MLRLEPRREDSRLGLFLVVSIVFHVLVLILYPQWEQSPLAGTLPGEGVFQFTLRQPTELSSFSLERVIPRQAVPQPQSRPSALQSAQPPQQQIQVAERPQQSTPTERVQAPAPRPEINPSPRQVETTSGEPVDRLPAALPTPSVRPEAPRSDVTADPVVTSDAGRVPVVAEQEGGTEQAEPSVETAAVGSVADTEGEAEVAPEESAPPAPPPPPPAVGSMLSFPGGMFIPKNYDRGWGTVSVRVIVTVDELGNVVAAEVDPTMRASQEAINEWALAYALQLVEAQPGPEGQAYQASFVIRFDPEGGGRGVTFGTDPEELIRLLLTD